MIKPTIDLVIVSPFYLPAPGGAARYYSILARQLLQDNAVRSVTIFTEAHPGCPDTERSNNGRLLVRRLFPFRAGNLEMARWVIPLYLYQQFQLLTLPFRVPRQHVVVLVHGYFHNRPGLAPISSLLYRMMRAGTSRLVIDLRDPRLPIWAFPTLYAYDGIVCCSQNVLDHIVKDRKLAGMARVIPIPFEVKRPSDEAIAAVLARFGLRRGGYIYSANGVQQDKNINEILAMTRELRRRGHDLQLVVAGRRRDWTARHDDAVGAGDMLYIGLVSHHDSLCLTACSALVPVISPTVESISRAALESLAMGAPVLLPPNIPEFHACCRSQIAYSLDPELLSDLAETVMARGNGTYDFSVHSCEKTASLYANYFMDLVSRRSG